VTSGDSLLPLPDARQKETSYVARSGTVVTLRLMDTGRWELKIDSRGDYTAVVTRRDDGLFDLQPAPGVTASPFFGVTDRELYERF
jgi:hypothetical protein